MSDLPKPSKIPSYRRRDDQALVTLTDARSKRRRDYWLGPYDTPASREAYYRVIAAWEANHRQWPAIDTGGRQLLTVAGPTVVEVILPYWQWAQEYYHHRRAGAIKTALALVRRYYGQTPALEFGPCKLRLVREQMIRGDATSKPPRPPWSRRYVNSQIQCVRAMFKWAAARELVPASVYQALGTLEPLKRGRSAARENPKVGPASQQLIDATRPYLSEQVRALVDLQLLTGARPGELVELRRCDLQVDAAVGIWMHRPDQHKNAYRERERVIYFGPRAQAVLLPFVTGRKTTAYLFRPAEAEAARRAAAHTARKTPLSCGNRPGTNRHDQPQCQPGEHYTTDSYRRAIEYACRRAFPAPAPLGKREDETRKEWKQRLTKDQRLAWRAWVKEHRWHPHQLRHNAATTTPRASC